MTSINRKRQIKKIISFTFIIILVFSFGFTTFAKSTTKKNKTRIISKKISEEILVEGEPHIKRNNDCTENILNLYMGKKSENETERIKLYPISKVERVEPKEELESEEEEYMPQAGGSVSMIYTLTATVSRNTGMINLYFKNPGDSTHNVLIQLNVNGIVIAESDLLSPGTGIFELICNNRLSNGEYYGTYNVLFFDSLTGEKALIETEICGVVITVTD